MRTTLPRTGFRYRLFYLLPCITMHAEGQQQYVVEKCNEVIKEASGKLNKITVANYVYKRDILYKEENYKDSFTSAVYIDFASNNNTAGFRFQADGSRSFSCYNGVQYFVLNKTTKTIDIRQKPGLQVFESLSPLYNSLVSIRNLLPLLVKNNSITKELSDTIIDKENYYLLKFELYDQYIGNLGGIHPFTAEYTGDKHKPYELILHKKTLLPYQYMTRFKDRPADFILATFMAIDTDPEERSELSWFYSTYTKDYVSPKPKEQLISAGAIPGDWKLPSYLPAGIDSVSLYQYRGKIVMLDFWIKSCGPCLASFPKLEELQQKFGTGKFKLLSINTEDNMEDIVFFYKKYKPSYPMLFGGEKLAAAYNISYYPTIVLFDKSGKLIYSGEFDKNEIEKIIKTNL